MISCFSCDKRCHYFNTCCGQQQRAKEDYIFQRDEWKCYSLHSKLFKSNGIGQIVVDKCPLSSTDREKGLCNEGIIGQWSHYSWLVTDNSTEIT